MATEMVERMARRLFNARHEGQIVGVAWEEPWPDEWKKSPYRKEAISILQELMEPTDEMLEAAMECGPVGCCQISEANAREIWSAMISSAIGGG